MGYLPQAGLTPELLKRIRSNPDFAADIVKHAKMRENEWFGSYYDASRILGLGMPVNGKLPKVKPDEMVIWYGGWTVEELRNLKNFNGETTVPNPAYGCIWTAESETKEPLVGFYRLRIISRCEQNRTPKERFNLLETNEAMAHPVLTMTAEICCYVITGGTMLTGTVVTGREQFPTAIYREGSSIGLTTSNSHGNAFAVAKLLS